MFLDYFILDFLLEFRILFILLMQ